MEKLQVDFAAVVSQFERAIKEFNVKKITYQTIFRGKGLEFDGYRNFEQDEDASMIDWKASLRSNKLLAKEYIEERNVDIYFVVDVSNSMLFGSGDKLKAEYAAEVVLSLAHLIINSNDNIGLVLFSDKVIKFIPPSKTKNQFYLFLKYLSEGDFYGGKISFLSAIDYVLKNITSRSSVVILVSDFINLESGLEKQLRLLGTKFESFALMIRDPLDSSLPKVKGQIVLQDPYSNQQITIDPSLAAEIYKQNAAKQKSFVKQLLKTSGIDLLELETETSFVLPMVSFLNARARGF